MLLCVVCCVLLLNGYIISKMSNSIMYSSHAMTHFNLVRLFLRRTMSTQHWSRVEMSKANTSTDGECDRNVRFEIVGDLVQTSKNCGEKHE